MFSRRFLSSSLVPRPSVRQRRRAGFTLVELLGVLVIVLILMVLVAPAFTTIKSADDITRDAYTIKGMLESARTYAKANNTYTWVGFYEEDGSVPSPAPAGTGRLVMSAVASNDGTMIYTGTLSSPVTLDPARLLQIGKLAKIDNCHLKTFPNGSGTGDTFDARPAVGSAAARIGDTTPPSPSLTFQYPVGSNSLSAQYTFVKAVQFGPRGEGVIDNGNYTFTPVSEIGLQPSHGSTADTASSNLAAIQFTGMGGNVTIYRK